MLIRESNEMAAYPSDNCSPQETVHCPLHLLTCPHEELSSTLVPADLTPMKKLKISTVFV